VRRHLVPKMVGAVVLLTALGGGAAYAFTASNTVPNSYAGQGTSTVSGYTVYNIDYGTCSTTDVQCLQPLNTTHAGDAQDGIDSVSFQLSPDNAKFAAIDVYDTNNNLLNGAGGAGNCVESAPGSPPSYGGPWASGAGVWTCTMGQSSGVTVSNIGYVDVEASQ